MAREVLQIETILHKHTTTFTLVLHSNAKEKGNAGMSNKRNKIITTRSSYKNKMLIAQRERNINF